MADNASEKALPDAAREGKAILGPEEAKVFARGLRAMNAREISYVVGGAFAKHAYTGVWRDTKDLDLFVKPPDLEASLSALAGAGFQTDVEFGHWLAKARRDSYVIDLIFGTGNGQLQVDVEWFARGRPVEIAGVKARLIPIEELLVSKAYIAERYRFDGADVVHLIRSAEGGIDWKRVLRLLGENRELLLWHLLLFDFVYPGHSDLLPRELIFELFEEMHLRWLQPAGPNAFRGTLLDPFSFIVDIEDRGYEDRRVLEPLVSERGKVL